MKLSRLKNVTTAKVLNGARIQLFCALAALLPCYEKNLRLSVVSLGYLKIKSTIVLPS